jgi:membrane protein YdbS with pleckstrin-like domain
MSYRPLDDAAVTSDEDMFLKEQLEEARQTLARVLGIIWLALLLATLACLICTIIFFWYIAPWCLFQFFLYVTLLSLLLMRRQLRLLSPLNKVSEQTYLRLVVGAWVFSSLVLLVVVIAFTNINAYYDANPFPILGLAIIMPFMIVFALSTIGITIYFRHELFSSSPSMIVDA